MWSSEDLCGPVVSSCVGAKCRDAVLCGEAVLNV